MSTEIVTQEETAGAKLLRVVIKSATAGVIGYVFVRVLDIGKGSALIPLLGKVSAATAVGATIGLGKFVQEMLEEYVIEPDTKDRYNEMLMNLFSPLLAAGATIVVGWTMLGVKGMAGLMRLGLTAGSAVMLSDYMYDNFLEGMMDRLTEEDLEDLEE
jgi:hypothetical protein